MESFDELVLVADNICEANKALVDALGPLSPEILWNATFKHDTPFNAFLSPPVDNCIKCGAKLQLHHVPTTVICYTWNGPIPAAKVTLRCKSCGINYRYEQFGNNEEGYQYYPEERPMIQSSQVRYLDRQCCVNIKASG